jgi:hypothetical protein
MRIPAIRGIIDRRILVNYRVERDALAALLPRPFRPKLIRGSGVAGICLIRLKHIRPPGAPKFLGLKSENAAHRIAVEWDQDGAKMEGVFVPRRDTSSRLNAFVGGRLFPGIHHLATFDVCEEGDCYRLKLDSVDGQTHVLVKAHLASAMPQESVFGSLPEASAFFERGSLGYSTTARPNMFHGLELRSLNWSVQPLNVANVESSFFEDRSLLPAGSVAFDSAFLMKNIKHEWHGLSPICCQQD